MVELLLIIIWFCIGWKVIQLLMELLGIGFIYWKLKCSWLIVLRCSVGMVIFDLLFSSFCSIGRCRISLFMFWELLRLNDCRNWLLRLIFICELFFIGGMVQWYFRFILMLLVCSRQRFGGRLSVMVMVFGIRLLDCSCCLQVFSLVKVIEWLVCIQFGVL